MRLGLAAVALLLLIALIVVVAGGGSATEREAKAAPEPSDAQRTYALLTGIPQHGTALGDPGAPVTLQFFGDLQCEESRQVMLGALPFLIRRWVRAGKLRIQFRAMQTDTRIWIEFREQQGAALAAGRQDKLWYFIDIFYRQQGPEFTGYADQSFLNRIASQAGLDLHRWEQDWSSIDAVSQLEADEAVAERGGLENTPSFLIGATGGRAQPLRHFSLEEPKVFDEAVEELLAA